MDKRSRAALKIKDRIFIEQILAKTYQEVEKPISTVILMPEVEDLDNEKKKGGRSYGATSPQRKAGRQFGKRFGLLNNFPPRKRKEYRWVPTRSAEIAADMHEATRRS